MLAVKGAVTYIVSGYIPARGVSVVASDRM
jgi:hypothetical protein